MENGMRWMRRGGRVGIRERRDGTRDVATKMKTRTEKFQGVGKC
jgi:hypothetical protein